jgi:flagellar hook-length control protein FliK
MHILPTIEIALKAVESVSDLFAFAGGQEDFSALLGRAAAEEAEKFPYSLQLREQSAPAEEDDAGAEGNSAPLEQAPLTPHDSTGVLYQTGEVGFTQQELRELRDKLLGEGLAPETLSQLEQLASHPYGATLGQMLALMRNGVLSGRTALSQQDRLNLRNFADAFDASGETGKKALSLLENGQASDAWKVLKNALNGLNGEVFTLRADDAAALGKAFGLSADAAGKILAQFGSAGELELTPELFGTLMVPLEDELRSREGQSNKLGRALAAHLQPLIDKARRRAESESQAAGGADRKSRQSEILIRDKVMSRFNESMAKAENGEETRDIPHDGKKAETDAPEGKIREASAYGEEKDARGDAKGSSRGERDGGGREQSRKRSVLPESALSRIEAREARPGPSAGANAAFAFAPPEGARADAAPQPNQAGASSAFQQSAFQQIERGFLSRAGDGSQRLELQLNPAELGSVTLILTSGKGGEIAAVIRAEKSETAELVSRHLEVMRVNLEEQGLKVDKLEVHSGLVNDGDRQWQGMDRHNAGREERESREVLERLRRLGRQGGNGESREQDMQALSRAGEHSGYGMHLVA